MKHNFSIRFKLTTYTIICFFVFLGCIVATASVLYSTSNQTIINNQIINTSKQVVSNYELYFDSAIDVSNAIQDKIDNVDVLNNKPTVRQYFDDVLAMKSEIISISLYDESGNLIVGNTNYVDDGKSNDESFQNAIDEPLINIFSAVGYEDNRYAFTLSRCVGFNREASEGVALIEFDFTKIVRLIYQSDLGENGHIVIFDRDYEVVYSSAPDFVVEDLNATRDLILGTSTTQINGQSFNLYVSTISNTGWKVAVFTNNSQIYSVFYSFITIVAIVTFVLSIIYVWIIYMIVKQVTYPLYRLQSEMNKVRDLNYEEKKKVYRKGNKEIVQLEDTYNEMMKRIRDLAEKIVQEQENQRKSELKALQNQINPHFLYNTLDSIIYMIDKGENQKAEEMIVALSKFFRISISKGRTIIPLKDEIEHVRNYLLIQKIRFGEHFSYYINVDQDLYQYSCLKLILQPLVENAIEHGLNDDENDGRIDINVYQDEKNIIFEVKDNGYGISEERLKTIYQSFKDDSIHEGVGLKNVYQRVKIYYGDSADLIINSIIDEGTIIRIIIPKEEAKKHEKK